MFKLIITIFKISLQGSKTMKKKKKNLNQVIKHFKQPQNSTSLASDFMV